MSGHPKCPAADLRPDAQRVLREIVRECLQTQQLGQDLPDEDAVSAAFELIEHGLMRLEHDGESAYRLMPTPYRVGDRHPAFGVSGASMCKRAKAELVRIAAAELRTSNSRAIQAPPASDSTAASARTPESGRALGGHSRGCTTGTGDASPTTTRDPRVPLTCSSAGGHTCRRD